MAPGWLVRSADGSGDDVLVRNADSTAWHMACLEYGSISDCGLVCSWSLDEVGRWTARKLREKAVLSGR